jgi:acyl-CoA reductase-like NAD-dependent aldehyde dehydrogenase
VKEEATLSNNIKPAPTVEAVNAAAASSASPSPAKQPDTLADLQHLRELIDDAVEAQRVYADFTQEQVDAIFKAAASAASAARIDLAVMAVTESGMGLMEDKVSNEELSHACMRCMVMAETAVNYRQHLTWAGPAPSVEHVAAKQRVTA